jgi:hypothetical protein
LPNLRRIRSLSEFLRKQRRHIVRLGETPKPAVLTVKGKAAVAIQEADGYRDLVFRLERAEGKGDSE